MPSRQRYTSQFKADAITRLMTAGYPKQRGALGRVAQELNIPDATLHQWFKHPTTPTRQPHRSRPHQPDHPATIPINETGQLADTSNNYSPDTLTLFRQEMKRIHAVLEAARAAASYKDLIAAWRGLNDDVQKLEQTNPEAPEDIETARAAFLEMLNQAAITPDPSEAMSP